MVYIRSSKYKVLWHIKTSADYMEGCLNREGLKNLKLVYVDNNMDIESIIIIMDVNSLFGLIMMRMLFLLLFEMQ